MLTIGSKLYRFNRMARENQVTVYTIGKETRQNWTLYGGFVVNKTTLQAKDGHHTIQFYTESQAQDLAWVLANKPAIKEALERADAATLRQIAALLGLPA
jgi:hypothetical protein